MLGKQQIEGLVNMTVQSRGHALTALGLADVWCLRKLTQACYKTLSLLIEYNLVGLASSI